MAVLGAGAMGAGIAQVAAAAGHPVHLVDALEGASAKAVDRIRDGLARQVAKGRAQQDEVEALLERISPLTTSDMTTVPAVALVVEAVVEHLDVKRVIFRQL